MATDETPCGDIVSHFIVRLLIRVDQCMCRFGQDPADRSRYKSTIDPAHLCPDCQVDLKLIKRALP